MKTTEHEIQVNCVNYFRLRYPKGLIFAIPNGGQRNVIVASKLKAEGVLSGVPDLCIPIAKKGYNGLYVELKNGKVGKVSDNQQTIMSKLQSEGYQCEVCRSFDEFRSVVDGYMLEEVKTEPLSAREKLIKALEKSKNRIQMIDYP